MYVANIYSDNWISFFFFFSKLFLRIKSKMLIFSKLTPGTLHPHHHNRGTIKSGSESVFGGIMPMKNCQSSSCTETFCLHYQNDLLTF